ncbi:MAG: zinc ribbon domain-containing protein, partial [Candidatus Electryoneaceae bacterium]|nr:zinc ribbon domain-containing protein [Candidatus Electryoneaceae bacterium]
MERENFYVLLELTVDPPENDPNVIKKVIQKKRSEWSSLLTNNPKKKLKAQLHLDMVQEIERVMLDDELRHKEAQDARKVIKQQQAELYKKLDAQIILISTKGEIFEKEIAILHTKFKIPESEIRKRINVPIVKAQQVEKRKPLAKTTVETINDALKILGQSSLYEFLSVKLFPDDTISYGPNSSLKLLLARAETVAKEVRKRGQKGAINMAKNELAGQCLSIFKTDDKRNAYDVSLASERLIELNNEIEAAGMDGMVSAEQYDILLKKAVQLGSRKDEADQYIQDFCKNRKWAIRLPSTLAVDELKQCGYCGVFNAVKAVNCSNCGLPLDLECPKCKKKNPSTNRSCTKCGFPIGDMPNAVQLIRSAKSAIGKKELDTAIRLFKEAEVFWPGKP